jgi:hypothetical protein
MNYTAIYDTRKTEKSFHFPNDKDQSTTMIYAAAVPDLANVIKGIECPIFVARVILFH